MADIKTLAEEAKRAVDDYVDAWLEKPHTGGRLSRARIDVAASIDALAEAHQAEVARLTRGNEGLRDLCARACSALDCDLRIHPNSTIHEDLRAALAGASGAQEGERT